MSWTSWPQIELRDRVVIAMAVGGDSVVANGLHLTSGLFILLASHDATDRRVPHPGEIVTVMSSIADQGGTKPA